MKVIDKNKNKEGGKIMLCQNCGENEANVRYMQIINGQKKEMILCERCARDLGVSNIDFNLPIDFASFLGEFLNDYNSHNLLPSFEKRDELKCKTCGLTYDDFISSGKFGCADCYDEFSERMDFVLKKLHGNNIHTGKKTKNIITKSENSNSKIPKATIKKPTKKDNLEKLQEDLKIAITEERYEDAAKIRDEIKKHNN